MCLPLRSFWYFAIKSSRRLLHFCFDFVSSGYFFSSWCGSRVKLTLLESLAKASRAPKGIKEYEYVIIWATTSLDSYLHNRLLGSNIRLAVEFSNTPLRTRDEKNKRVSKKKGNTTFSLRTLRSVPSLGMLLRSTFLVYRMGDEPSANSPFPQFPSSSALFPAHRPCHRLYSRRRLRGLGGTEGKFLRRLSPLSMTRGGTASPEGNLVGYSKECSLSGRNHC